MFRTLAVLSALLIFAGGAVWGQQPSPASSGAAQGILAKAVCRDESSVSVTADSEQAIPLKLVATLKCDEEIRVLSDMQGYTVKVRTASGKVGYVTRYEVAVVPPSAPSVSSANAASNHAAAQSAPKPAAEASPGDRANDPSKPHVYVSDTQSWTETGGFGRASSVADGNLYGGYDPEMTDIYQDFTSDCPAVVVTQEKSNADYAVLFDKGTSKKGITGLGGLVKVNKVTVVTRSGETIFSQAAHSTDTIVRLACEAISQKSSSTSAAAAGPHP
ncbi:MAG TPA: hypothetical protein VLY23_08085 [Candidatus Acidoferrum sp.]|nr:hypothetical protein [Candidatus Acidoferrum sp.]